MGESVRIREQCDLPQILDVTTSGGRDGNLSIDSRALQQIIINGSDQNQINLDDLPDGITATVNGGTGSDIVNISPSARNLDHIQGQIAVINNNGGSMALTVDDSSDQGRQGTGLTHRRSVARGRRSSATRA